MVSITIIISQQVLICENGASHNKYIISTAKNGVGNQNNSQKTPLGHHKIKLKIGENCPVNSVFISRRATGEIYNSQLAYLYLNRDWILTRILWLQGLEVGINRGNNIDSLKRFIYIHGTPDTEAMGVAQSHGCIRMRNQDIVLLFNMVSNNTQVLIKE